jgi:hypothetical protein
MVPVVVVEAVFRRLRGERFARVLDVPLLSVSTELMFEHVRLLGHGGVELLPGKGVHRDGCGCRLP